MKSRHGCGSNWLQLKAAKTEILLSSSNRSQHQLPDAPLTIDAVKSVLIVRNPQSLEFRRLRADSRREDCGVAFPPCDKFAALIAADRLCCPCTECGVALGVDDCDKT